MINTTTIVILILALVVATVLARIKNAPLGYRKKKALMTKAELSFFHVLRQAVGDDALIACKVRIADVLEPKKGGSQKQWRIAFNRIAYKHFDFLLISPTDSSILAAIELDDSSHTRPKVQKSDNLKNHAAETSGLPLVRFTVKRGYIKDEIRSAIRKPLGIVAPLPANTSTTTSTEPTTPERKEPVFDIDGA